jgi:hypothetical protein
MKNAFNGTHQPPLVSEDVELNIIEILDNFTPHSDSKVDLENVGFRASLLALLSFVP